MATQLAPLPTKPSAPRGHAIVVNAPWRYLKGAHESVQSVLKIFDDVHAAIGKARGQKRGTLRQEEQELLRSALVLTASGLDATMTTLVRVALPPLIDKGGSAAARYNAWLRMELVPAQPVSKPIIDAATSKDPTSELVAAYVKAKTTASYQGSGEISDRVRDLLCLPQSSVSNSAITALDPFFIARNAIVHAMDYADPSNSSKTTRNTRSGPFTVAECDRAFEVCAKLITATTAAL